MIANAQTQVNSYKTNFSNQTSVTTLLPRLTNLEDRILGIYYEDWQLNLKKSNRSLDELSIRLKRHRNNISCALARIQRLGLMNSDPHGCSFKNRWITLEGFAYLETKPRTQTRTQIEATPYIYLSDQEMINSLSLKESQNGGQLDQNLDSQTKLDNFLERKMVSYKVRREIKIHLEASKIGPQRKEAVINRVIASDKKNSIQSHKGYFVTALRNEEKDLIKTLRYFQNQNIDVNFVRMYA